MDRSRPRRRRGMSLIMILLVVAVAGAALFFGLRTWRKGAVAARTSSRLQSEAQFRADHKLTGVSIANDARHAIIDGRAMAVGQSVDGRTLVEVTERSARFRSTAGEIVLELPRKAGGTIGPVVNPTTRPRAGMVRATR